VDGGTLSYVIVTQPAKGALSGVAPNLTYTPSVGSTGSDSFSYRASDGSLSSNTAMVSISIHSTNRAPVAVAGTIRTVEEAAAPFVLTANDPDGDLLSYIIQQGPQNGVLSGTAPNLTYTPATGFIGADSFTFKASDGSLASNTVTIAIEVVSDGLSDDSKLIERSGWVLRYVDSEDSPDQAAINAFDGDPDTFWHTRWQSGATPPPHEIQIDLGNLHTLEGFRYLPRQDGFTVGGIAQYEFYTSLDGTNWGTPVASGTFVQGSMEQEALFAATPARFIRLRSLSEVNGAIHCSVAELNVLGTIGADLPPLAESRSFNTGEGNPISVALVASDPENAALVYEILSNPRNGTLTGTAPGLIYTPSTGFSGADSFTFRVSDGKNQSDAATVSITIKPNKIETGNRPPVFNSNSFDRSAGAEGASYRGASLDETATDPDQGDGLSFSKISGPSWLRIAANGSLSGTPPAGSEGQNRFTIRVTDEVGSTDTAQLLIEIKAARLPLPWDAEKIGDVAGPLLATHDSGTFTMEGKGSLSGSSDEANFVWQLMSGDGEIIARVSSMSGGDSLSRAGVMIRDSLAPNSKHVFMGVNGSGDFRMVRRNQKGNPALGKSAGKGSFPEAWVRLVRKNDTITSYKSNNGSDWKRAGTYKVDFSAQCYIGLSISGGKGNSATATFRNVKVKD
jgi:F5/8 type C domain/Bacterial Ig domain